MKTIKKILITILILAALGVAGYFAYWGITDKKPFEVSAATQDVYSFGELISTPFGNSSFTAIIHDSQYIYASTQGGKFAIFDKSTQTFDELITTPLGTGTYAITALIQDDEKVYLGGNSTGIVTFDKVTQTFSELIPVPFPYFRINCFIQDNENIYTFVNQGKFAILNKSTLTYSGLIPTPFDSTAASNTYATQDSNYIYAGGATGKFAIFDKVTQTFGDLISTPFGSTSGILTLEQDDENVFIGGSSGKFAIYNKATQTFGELMNISGYNIQGFTQDSNNLYMADNNGCFIIYNKATQSFDNFTAPFAGTNHVFLICDNNLIYGAGPSGKFAIFTTSKEIQTFTVTYQSGWDGSPVYIDNITLNEGEIIPNILAAEVEGYVFSYWYTSRGGCDVGTPITADTILIAIYEDVTYTITYHIKRRDDTPPIKIVDAQYTKTLANKKYVTTEPAPEMQHGLVFSHWEFVSGCDVGTPITADTVFRGVYELELFTVTYLDVDGSIYTQLTLPFLSIIPELDEVPSADGQEFVQWIPVEGSMIGHPLYFNTTVQARSQVVTYTVTYQDHNGEVVKTSTLKHGQYIEDNPGVIGLPQIDGYEFSHWQVVSGDEPDTDITQDTVLRAVYSKKAQYTIQFFGIDEKLISSTVVESGQSFTFPNYTAQYYNIAYWQSSLISYMPTDTVTNVSCDADYYAVGEKIMINVTYSYYMVERLYYTKQNTFLWIIPTGTSYKYADFVVYRTSNADVWIGEKPDFSARIGIGLYDIPKHLSVSGFEFKGWDNDTKNGLPVDGKLYYKPIYELPSIAVRYYGSNGKYIETREIDVKFVPLPEMTNNFKWYEGMEKYFNDIFIKWSPNEAAHDLDARSHAKEMVKYLSNRYVQGSYEVYFMVALLDVDIDAAFGIFKSAAAGVKSSTFQWLCGASSTNDFVYYADLSGLYVQGLKYDVRIEFDTPYDFVLNFLSAGLKWFLNKGWIYIVVGLVFIFIGIPLLIRLGKEIKHGKRKQYRKSRAHK